jgi:RNA polymerase sigma factor (sigma-70 family)
MDENSGAVTESGTADLGRIQSGDFQAVCGIIDKFLLLKTAFSIFNEPVNEVRDTSDEKAGAVFPTTHWTTLLVPISQRTEQSQAALNRLFGIYRQPILNYVRTLVRDPQQAEDIAHDFVVRLLSREDLANADRAKGRFRHYLGTSVKNYVITHYQAEDAKKRRLLNRAVSLDDLVPEPCDCDNGEKDFTRQWWRATIDEALRRLRVEWETVGKGELFADLEPLLWEKKDQVPIYSVAAKHQMSCTAVRLRKMRLLTRLREMLLVVVGETVGSSAQVEEEIRHLLQGF